LVEARREESAAAVEGVVVPAVPVPVPVVLVPVPVDKVLATELVTGSSELVVEASVLVLVPVPVVDTVLAEEPELVTVAPIKNDGLVP